MFYNSLFRTLDDRSLGVIGYKPETRILASLRLHWRVYGRELRLRFGGTRNPGVPQSLRQAVLSIKEGLVNEAHT
jgi:hypothetical protein